MSIFFSSMFFLMCGTCQAIFIKAMIKLQHITIRHANCYVSGIKASFMC